MRKYAEEAQPPTAGWTVSIQMTKPILQQKLGMAAFAAETAVRAPAPTHSRAHSPGNARFSDTLFSLTVYQKTKSKLFGQLSSTASVLSAKPRC